MVSSVVKMLSEGFLFAQAGASPNVQDCDGWTATHNSARNGRNKCVLVLLKNQADLHLTTRYGETPLHVACRKGKTKVVNAIVEYAKEQGILTKLQHAKDSDGRTPLEVAFSKHIRSILCHENTSPVSQYDEDSGTMLIRQGSLRHLGQAVVAPTRTCNIL